MWRLPYLPVPECVCPFVYACAVPPLGAGEIRKVEGRSIYTVKLGDTLSDIARRFETTVEILVQVRGPPSLSQAWAGPLGPCSGEQALQWCRGGV